MGSAATAVGMPPPAGGATQIGHTLTPNAGVADKTILQSGSVGNSYAAPFGGVITSWSHQAAGSVFQLKLKVGRPQGENVFTIIGQSDLETLTPGVLNTFDTRISVAAGDVIGFYATTN